MKQPRMKLEKNLEWFFSFGKKSLTGVEFYFSAHLAGGVDVSGALAMRTLEL